MTGRKLALVERRACSSVVRARSLYLRGRRFNPDRAHMELKFKPFNGLFQSAWISSSKRNDLITPAVQYLDLSDKNSIETIFILTEDRN